MKANQTMSHELMKYVNAFYPFISVYRRPRSFHQTLLIMIPTLDEDPDEGKKARNVSALGSSLMLTLDTGHC